MTVQDEDLRALLGIDPERLQTALEVIAELDELPVDHPDAVAVRLATGRLFKQVKERRRRERRDAQLAHDAAVTAATATAAPGRIDDETRGLPLTTETAAPLAGRLQRARACYSCKQRYVDVDAFYHQLCPACAALNRSRRDARTDLTGRRALLTGGRAKIGMHIALRLLRDGADTTITTRFPRDAVRRFTSMPDSADWLHRLHVVGIDLRDPAQVIALADEVAARGPLDVLINNAAQTVRRSPGAYGHLVAAEAAAAARRVRCPSSSTSATPPTPTRRRSPPDAAGVHAARRDRAGARQRLGVPRARRRPDRHRRRRSRPRPRQRQQLDAHRLAGRRPRDARGAAVQLGGAVRARRPPARRRWPPRRPGAPTS